MTEMQNPKSRRNPELAPARYRTPANVIPQPGTGASNSILSKAENLAALRHLNHKIWLRTLRFRSQFEAAAEKYGRDEMARVAAEIRKNGDESKIVNAPDFGEAIAAYGNLKDYHVEAPLSG